MPVDKTNVTAIARRAVNGDTNALADLLGELAPFVVRTTRLIVGAGTAAAEDAAQEALIDVARRIATLRDPEAVVSWAAQIATRRALRAARSERLRRQSDVEVQAVQSPERVNDHRAALSAAFDRLPRRQRAIAVLRLYAGFSERETADVLGITLGAVKSQLHQARSTLSAALP